MKKLVIKLPKEMNATLLLTAAFALTHYADEFDVSHRPCGLHKLYKEEIADALSNADSVNEDNGVAEYEVDAARLDPFVMEELVKLQTLVPFEMHFENRGFGDNEEYWDYRYEEPDIYDHALWTLNHSEPAVYATVAEIKKWRARQTPKTRFARKAKAVGTV